MRRHPRPIPEEHFSRRAGRHRGHRRRAKPHLAALIVLTAVLVTVGLSIGGVLLYRHVQDRRQMPPPPEVYTVVIPEGLTVGQTAARFESQTDDGIPSAAFRSAAESGAFERPFLTEAGGNLEGFLFPKTYEVTSLITPLEAVEMLLDQFEKETAGIDWGRADPLGLTPYEIVTVASMIEKEVSVPEERPLVASVIYNRLRSNMRLEIDATVQYALGEWRPALTYEDLRVESPYNTYRVFGLPPAPICSPGFESIRAALYPEETDYLFYILTSPADGRHSFTSDYQQFLLWKEEQNKR